MKPEENFVKIGDVVEFVPKKRLIAMYKTCTVCGGIHPFDSNRCRKNAYNTRLDYSRKDIGHAFRQEGKYRNLAKIVREDSKNLCAVCLDEGVCNSKRVEVHHIEPIKNRPDLVYDYDNFICLCNWHHKYAEKGLIGKDYLKKLPPWGRWEVCESNDRSDRQLFCTKLLEFMVLWKTIDFFYRKV